MLYWESANVDTGSGTYLVSGWLFLRLLGLIYLVAFVSLGVQIKGLVGSRGILPARNFLLGKKSLGWSRFLRIPTLCWWTASDSFLRFLCWGGAGLSVLLTIGIAPVPVLILLWAFYLSLFSVCRIFLGYQWDILLLETGFLAILAAPFELWPRFSPSTMPSPVILWLLWWLLFRLMFSSGFVKLRSGDRTWRNLTALRYHYETQPLPPWTAWYMNLLPQGFQKLSAILMFIIELLMPVLVFAPPPLSYIAGVAFVFLMVLIMITGNYCFFNLLAIALSVLIFHDAFWLPLFEVLGLHFQFSGNAVRAHGWPLWVTLPVAAVIALLSTDVLSRLFRWQVRWPRLMEQAIEYLEPFRLVNSYGLFSVMTTERPEIVVEGSNDEVNWIAYEFKWKPGDVRRRPRFAAPHQPRLDWQMWFAALGYYHTNPWCRRFLLRLLQGSVDVLALLRTNPFPGKPPQFVRAVVYVYRFTDYKLRRESGAWWERERRGIYSPALSLRDAPGPNPGSNADE